MKKQLLTTAAALAMLAPTMTSFAATQTGQVGGLDTQNYSSDLKITGTVNDANGAAPEGQISVTLPTAVSFVVDEDSNVITPNDMSIVNNGKGNITVSVASFTDSTPDAGITVVNSSELTSKNRSFVSLALSANGKTATLLSNGFQTTDLGEVTAGATVGLSLTGAAGTEEAAGAGQLDETGANDTFTLVFNIAKVKQ